MPHTYRVVKRKNSYKIKSKTRVFKRNFKTRATAEAAIRNLYRSGRTGKLAKKGSHTLVVKKRSAKAY